MLTYSKSQWMSTVLGFFSNSTMRKGRISWTRLWWTMKHGCSIKMLRRQISSGCIASSQTDQLSSSNCSNTELMMVLLYSGNTKVFCTLNSMNIGWLSLHIILPINNYREEYRTREVCCHQVLSFFMPMLTLHTVAFEQDLLQKFKWEQFKYPLYSLDLV